MAARPIALLILDATGGVIDIRFFGGGKYTHPSGQSCDGWIATERAAGRAWRIDSVKPGVVEISRDPDEPEGPVCPECQGAGRIVVGESLGTCDGPQFGTCPQCGGSGRA